MVNACTAAQALLDGDREALAGLAARLIKPLNDNLVERPWGGMRMLEYKALSGVAVRRGFGLGEAFELAADDRDPEARAHPSRIRCADGSQLSLPALLERHAEAILGAPFVRRHGARFPLLPKTLDVAELLSVQGHPAGNTEVYVIIGADPGATIRLGFNQDVDAAALRERLIAGRRDQQSLLARCRADADPHALQQAVGPWLADRASRTEALEPALAALLAPGVHFASVVPTLTALHALYWSVLDSMNEIPVAAGQVIYNANPPRIAREPSAEVHALGNPQGKEVVALEIRRPGPTFRAWDNVRFPLREIDVEAAIEALNLRRTEPHEFNSTLRPVPGRPGVAVSVDSASFRLEHLQPAPGRNVDVPAAQPHSLHAIEGQAVLVSAASGAQIGTLARGESALVPIGVGGYRVSAAGAAHIVKVDLPDGDS